MINGESDSEEEVISNLEDVGIEAIQNEAWRGSINSEMNRVPVNCGRTLNGLKCVIRVSERELGAEKCEKR